MLLFTISLFATPYVLPVIAVQRKAETGGLAAQGGLLTALRHAIDSFPPSPPTNVELAACSEEGCTCVADGNTMALGPGRVGDPGLLPEVNASANVSSIKSFWDLQAPFRGELVKVSKFGIPMATLIVNVASA